jgi:hypothetical protein
LGASDWGWDGLCGLDRGSSQERLTVLLYYFSIAIDTTLLITIL